MQATSLGFEASEGPPPSPPNVFAAARPSRELFADLIADANRARAAGRLDDAALLLDVVLQLRRVDREHY